LGKRDNRAGEAAAIKRPEAASACGPTKGRRRGRAADAVGPRPGARVRPRGRDDAWDPPVGDTRGERRWSGPAGPTGLPKAGPHASD
jgi:hypothetical protein